MKIIVIGNGFDLASGLPTSYKDFFKYRKEQIEAKYHIKDKLEGYRKQYFDYDDGLAEESRIKLKSAWSSMIEKNENVALEEPFETQLRNAINSNLKQMSDINFFDLYFDYLKLGDVNWWQIEEKLEKLVTSKYHDFFDKRKNDNSKLYRAEIDIFFKKIILSEYVKNIRAENPKMNDLELLKIDLKKFEENFRMYIDSICEVVRDSIKYSRVYMENFESLMKVIPDNVGEMFTINFNYSKISDLSKLFLTHETNVHGESSKQIIFGFDPKKGDSEKEDISYKTPEYMFTKTYRKIEQEVEGFEFPKDQEPNIDTQYIIFYGHSLSEADYSYFQSLFDMYDIYHHTKLIFIYSIYDENDAENIRTNNFKNVTKLISTYGETMDNKDHGKNLLHKLLLEGRLQLKEIELEKIEDFKIED